MGEQRNLTEENVEELKKYLERMKEQNPDLTYRFFPQNEEPQSERVEKDVTHREIIDKLDKIEAYFKLVFGGHCLVNGKFEKILI